MKNLITFAFLTLSVSALAQQQDSTNTMKMGFYTSVMAVGASSALEDLNQQLRAAGQLPVSEGLFGVSVGFTSRFADQNSYSSARLSVLATANENPDNNQATRLIMWELIGLGHYDVVANPNWLVYPYLGLGTSYGRLTVSSIEPGNSFSNSLSNPGNDEVRQKKYGTDGLMLIGELGGGVERILRLNGSNTYLGISGGYRLSTEEAWALNNVKTFEGTSFGTQGWTFEFKFRVEMNPSPDQEVSRGLFKFFQ